MLLDVRIICSCVNHVDGTVYVPHPNYLADNEESSLSEHWEDVWCSSCGKDYKVYIAKTFNNLKCHLNDTSVGFDYGTPYENEESALSQYNLDEYLEVFSNQVNSAEKIINLDVSEDIEFNLLVMIHGHVVAAIEGYLASVCMKKIIESDDLMRKLLESDPDLGSRTLTLKSLYQEKDKVEETITKYLDKLIFHKIDKVKTLYKSFFDIDFGNVRWLFLAVKLRHDCVHRGGYKTNGKKVEMDRDCTIALIKNARALIEKIEYLLKEVD